MKLLQKDHYLFGLGVGLATPVLLFGLILLINYVLLLMGVAKFYLDLHFFGRIRLAGSGCCALNHRQRNARAQRGPPHDQ